MEFHERLKLYRRGKGLTQEELAERLYVSRSAVAKWENGLGLPNAETLKELAAFFGVTQQELLSDRETEAIIVEKNGRLSRQKKWLIGLGCLVAVLLAAAIFLGVFLPRADRSGIVGGGDVEILGIEASFHAEYETLKGDVPLKVYHLKAGETYEFYVRLLHRGSRDVSLGKGSVRVYFDTRFFSLDEGEYWEEPDRDATPAEEYPFYLTCSDRAAYTEIFVTAGEYWCKAAVVIEAA